MVSLCYIKKYPNITATARQFVLTNASHAKNQSNKETRMSNVTLIGQVSVKF